MSLRRVEGDFRYMEGRNGSSSINGNSDSSDNGRKVLFDYEIYQIING